METAARGAVGRCQWKAGGARWQGNAQAKNQIIPGDMLGFYLGLGDYTVYEAYSGAPGTTSI